MAAMKAMKRKTKAKTVTKAMTAMKRTAAKAKTKAMTAMKAMQTMKTKTAQLKIKKVAMKAKNKKTAAKDPEYYWCDTRNVREVMVEYPGEIEKKKIKIWKLD